MEGHIPVSDASEALLSSINAYVLDVIKASEEEVDRLAVDAENLMKVLKEHYKSE